MWNLSLGIGLLFSFCLAAEDEKTPKQPDGDIFGANFRKNVEDTRYNYRQAVYGLIEAVLPKVKASPVYGFGNSGSGRMGYIITRLM